MGIMLPKTNLPAPFFMAASLLRRLPVTVDFLCDNRISDKHWHDYVQVWYTVSGKYNHTINGITRKQTPGSLAVVFPFAIHQIDSSESDISELRVIKCDFPFDVFQKNQLDFKPLNYLTSAFDRAQLHTFMKISGKEKEKVDILFCDMLNLFFDDFTNNSGRIFSLIDKVFELFSKNLPSLDLKEINLRNASALCINNSVTFLTRNYSNKITVDEASSYAVMSRRSFLEYFKQITGRTCHDYLTSVRIEVAIKRMRWENKTMSEISDECGFSNSAHFSKIISSTFKMSPTDLKQKLNEWDIQYTGRAWKNRVEHFRETGEITSK